MEVPVFLITGFLESGKTSFITETMSDPEFAQGEKTLLIVCEEGEEEYDEDWLLTKQTKVVYVEDKSELTGFFFKDLNAKYRPERVLIEYNGVWQMTDILDVPMPSDWILVQTITTVDASTFENYLNNMRQLIMEQLQYSDTVIFNRCSKETKKSYLRRNIKVINAKAQIIYEAADGEDTGDDEEELPFDISGDMIELMDEDYGLWYIDAMDNPQKYEGKIIKFTAMVYKPKGFSRGYIVPGRHAMTCCADDIRFIGFICKTDKSDKLKDRDWIKLTAQIKCEKQRAYRGVGPVLYAKKIEFTDEPKDKLVYFT